MNYTVDFLPMILNYRNQSSKSIEDLRSIACSGESLILKRNKPFRFQPLIPRQATGNALADGFNKQE